MIKMIWRKPGLVAHTGLQNATSQYSDHILLMALQQLVGITHESFISKLSLPGP